MCTISRFLLIFSLAFIAGADLIVDTKYGQLEGAQFYVDGSSWPGYKFLNIPFAAPPIGQLRFKPPQPVPAWDGIRDATKHGRVALSSSLHGNPTLFCFYFCILFDGNMVTIGHT